MLSMQLSLSGVILVGAFINLLSPWELNRAFSLSHWDMSLGPNSSTLKSPARTTVLPVSDTLFKILSRLAKKVLKSPPGLYIVITIQFFFQITLQLLLLWFLRCRASLLPRPYIVALA